MGCIGSKRDVSRSNTQRISNLSELVVQPSTFVTSNEKKFQEVYQMGKLLGTGRFGEVRSCLHRQHNADRAVKIYRKDLLRSTSARTKLLQEIDILKKLDHPNCVRVYELFEDEKRYYIVMERCQGGELFEELIKRKAFSEHDAAEILRQLLSVVAYLHENNVIHRDLKPENILLDEQDGSLHIKLIDFGNATFYVKNATVSGAQGTAFYIAPEVLTGTYTEKCDTWSCGVILYILLSGMPPFDGNTDNEILEKVTRGNYSFPEDSWSGISQAAKDFIDAFLCPEPIRLSAAEALTHEWITANAGESEIDPDKLNRILKNLSGFHSTNKLRDAVNTYIATQCISAADTKDLRDAFTRIDVNGDGKLSRDELFAQYVTLMGHAEAEEEVNRIMSEVDSDHNGFIDYTEFIKASMDKRKVMSIDNLRIAFDLFDKDGSGSISKNELKVVLEGGAETKDRVWTQIIKEVDQNGDGEIDLHEFEEIVLRNI